MRTASGVLLLALVSAPASPAGAMPEKAAGERPETIIAHSIPHRPAGAMTGSEFAASTRGVSGSLRQKRALAELMAGNIPGFLRRFRPVELPLADGGRGPAAVTVWVAPDYLAIGSDDDFLRIPLDYYTATTVANRFGCVLPTPKIVDAVYEQSDFRLTPQPMNPGPMMRSSAYYLRHQQLIEGQRRGRPLDALVAGHKKDLVITNRLNRRAKRVAIYGWHRAARDSIQPLSTVHAAHYADYSHGVRLIWRTVRIGGVPHDIQAVLGDPELAPALTYEGSIPEVYRLMHPSPGGAAAVTPASRADSDGR